IGSRFRLALCPHKLFASVHKSRANPLIPVASGAAVVSFDNDPAIKILGSNETNWFSVNNGQPTAAFGGGVAASSDEGFRFMQRMTRVIFRNAAGPIQSQQSVDIILVTCLHRSYRK